MCYSEECPILENGVLGNVLQPFKIVVYNNKFISYSTIGVEMPLTLTMDFVKVSRSLTISNIICRNLLCQDQYRCTFCIKSSQLLNNYFVDMIENCPMGIFKFHREMIRTKIR